MEIINLLDFTDRIELREWLKVNHNRVKSCWVVTSRSKQPHTNVFHTLKLLKKHCASGGLFNSKENLPDGALHSGFHLIAKEVIGLS